jgi:glycosyltransferase involved in cell wall biosynthesis
MAPTRPPRIAFFSHSAGVAGAERALVHAIQQAAASGCAVRAYLPGEGPLRGELDALGVPNTFFPTVKQFDVVPDWWTIQHWHNMWIGFGERVAALRAELSAAEVDLVYVNTIYPVEAGFAAAHLGLPLIWHPHELYHKQFHDWLLGMPLFQTLMGALSDVVVAVSSPCLAALRPYVPAEKLSLVHEPVDWHALQEPRPTPEDLREERASAQFVLACVGSIDKRKAQSDLLQALALLPRELASRCVTWVVGTPSGQDFHDEFQRELAGLPKHVRVRWLGQRTDVAAILQTCDALIHPSVNDPFPLAVLEALACGKPVVAALGGGVAECIEEGVTGRLVPVSAPAALAEAMADVLEDPARMAAMGRAARQSVRKYDLAVYARGIDAVLRKARDAQFDSAARRVLAEDFEQRVTLLARNLPSKQVQPVRPPPTLAHRVRKTLKGLARKVREG